MLQNNLGACSALVVSFLLGAAPAQESTAAAVLLTELAGVPATAAELADVQRRENPSIVASRFVRVDTRALRSAQVGATFALDLFDARETLTINRTFAGRGHRLVHGALTGREATVVFAVRDDGATAASIDFGHTGFELAYTGVGNVHALHRLDHRLGDGRPCGTDHTHHVHEAKSGDEDRHGANDATRTVIDVAVFYTPAARASGGGNAALEATIAMRIGVASQTCIDSDVDHEYRLVHVAETNYTEVGDSSDLGRFRSTTDGFMDEVHQKRTDYGADLMCLIINNAGFCGVGYLMTNVSTNFRTSAFSATVRSCMTGHTLTHEMGHTMACHHDPDNGSGAAYPYSYGYRTPDNAFRTVMAYSPGTRVARWSNPNTIYNGYPMGVADTQDNHRSLNNVKNVVSQFYSTQTLYWCDLTGGVGGSLGKPTIDGAGTVSTAAPIEITIRNTPSAANGALMLGLSRLDFPIFGAVIVPNPDLVIPVTGSASSIVVNVSAIRRLGPGADAYFQAFFIDPTAPQGLAASDALKTTRP